MTDEQLFAVDLASLPMGEGKPFDGMAAGTFTDMYGRRVTFKPADLADYVTNTQNVLEKTRDSTGEIVGLPIDAMNHDHAEAAGWIVGVELEGAVIRFLPRWTDRGRELISGNIVRYFSPSVNLENKTILGGSLTNWPATRDEKTGEILLKPVELSEGLDPAAVLAELRGIRAWISGLFHRDAQPEPENVDNGGGTADTLEGVMTMDVTKDELNAMIADAITAALASQPPAEQPKAELSALVDAAGLSEEVKNQRKAELAALMANERAQAELEFRAQLERSRFEGKMTELASRLTGGSDAHPYGLRIGAEELQAHLMKLDPDEAQFWGGLLTVTQEKGLIEFGEAGHGRVMQGTRELPAPMAGLLRKWLAGGGDLNEFFAVNAVELGSMADYNLVDFQGKEK